MPNEPITVEKPEHPLHALATYELAYYRRRLENALAFLDKQDPVPAIRADLQAALDGVLTEQKDRAQPTAGALGRHQQRHSQLGGDPVQGRSRRPLVAYQLLRWSDKHDLGIQRAHVVW